MKFLQRSIVMFGLAFAGNLYAQAPLCSGDPVVVVLNGYKYGNTTWEQSSDQTLWSAAQGTSYNDSLVITASTTLYYRAKVTDGTCNSFYSDTTLITVRSVLPPTAKPASNITLLSFEAQWTTSGDSTTNYFLDVATDNNFTSFVSGYNNLPVNGKTSNTVTDVYCNTTYYYRVRAYDDSCGITSGNSNTMSVITAVCPAVCTYKSTCTGNLTDSRDGLIYKTIQIGSQCWMAQNLNVGTRIDGVLFQTQGLENQNADIQKYCYGDNTGNCNIFGGLYMWDEMMAYGSSQTDAPSIRGICPVGWHIPTDNEWKCLEETLGGNADSAGGKLKSTDNSLWLLPNTGASNSSGFNTLPGGYREYPIILKFSGLNTSALIWSATEEVQSSNGKFGWTRNLNYNSAQVFRNGASKNSGISIRCVKD